MWVDDENVNKSEGELYFCYGQDLKLYGVWCGPQISKQYSIK